MTRNGQLQLRHACNKAWEMTYACRFALSERTLEDPIHSLDDWQHPSHHSETRPQEFMPKTPPFTSVHVSAGNMGYAPGVRAS